MIDHTKTMERTVLERYADLIGALGNRTEALEIICGVFRTGDIRPAFLEHTFGRQILDEANRLSAQHCAKSWENRFPSLWNAAEFIRTSGFPG